MEIGTNLTILLVVSAVLASLSFLINAGIKSSEANAKDARQAALASDDLGMKPCSEVGHKLDDCYDEHEHETGSLCTRRGDLQPLVLTDYTYRGHVCLRCGASFNTPPVVEDEEGVDEGGVDDGLERAQLSKEAADQGLILATDASFSAFTGVLHKGTFYWKVAGGSCGSCSMAGSVSSCSKDGRCTMNRLAGRQCAWVLEGGANS